MASTDRERWNERYRQGDQHTQPDAWLIGHAEMLAAPHPGSRALDLACGSGRHTFWLAELGYTVDAWDISDAGLQLLDAELARRQPRLPVTTSQVDLERATIPADTYDLILDAFFLERSLFASMITGLRTGGLVIVNTLLRRDANEDRNSAHLLQPGELRAVFGKLQILDDYEDPQAGRAGIIARK
jgi:SAM-dependent methyltransferase